VVSEVRVCRVCGGIGYLVTEPSPNYCPACKGEGKLSDPPLQAHPTAQEQAVALDEIKRAARRVPAESHPMWVLVKRDGFDPSFYDVHRLETRMLLASRSTAARDLCLLWVGGGMTKDEAMEKARENAQLHGVPVLVETT
jgi:hypothetical protein